MTIISNLTHQYVCTQLLHLVMNNLPQYKSVPAHSHLTADIPGQ